MRFHYKKEYLNLFLLTLFNDMNNDMWASNVSGLKRPIVRPGKFDKLARKNIYIHICIWSIASFLVFLLLFPYFIILFIFSLLKCARFKRIRKFPKEIFLGFTGSLLEKRLRYANISYKNSYWLVRPFSKAIVPGKSMTVYHVASLQDLFGALLCSFCVVPLIIRKHGLSNVIYAANSFGWFLVFFSFKKMDGINKIYFANQKDRWAVLFDNLPVKNKVLLQHGIEDGDDFDVVKLKTITTVFAFNQREAEVLKTHLLDCNPDIFFYNHSLNLTTSYINTKSVLIIGNCFECFDMEERIIRLLQPYEIRLVLKPHPLLDKTCYHKLGNKFKLEILNDDVYPKVDLVLSYRSTLAVEYEMLDIRVMYHDDFSLDSVLKYMNCENSII